LAWGNLRGKTERIFMESASGRILQYGMIGELIWQ